MQYLLSGFLAINFFPTAAPCCTAPSLPQVMEYADHDLKSVMERRLTQPFSTAEVKCLMLQLLAGTAYLHDNWVLHRYEEWWGLNPTITAVLRCRGTASGTTRPPSHVQPSRAPRPRGPEDVQRPAPNTLRPA